MRSRRCSTCAAGRRDRATAITAAARARRSGRRSLRLTARGRRRPVRRLRLVAGPGHADLRALLWLRLATERLGRGSPPREADQPFPGCRHGAVTGGGAPDDEIWCRVDHGPHGFLSIAAHAHADALSIELRCGGVEVLVDPGTYTYQGEAAWRSYFRSTIGHNCLELAGKDQSIQGGPFLWTRAAGRGRFDERPRRRAKAVWRAAHEGYLRLSPGARHERTVTLDREARRVLVEDALDGAGEHGCRLAFHLGPAVDCHLDGIGRSSPGRPHRQMARADAVTGRLTGPPFAAR